MSEGTRSYLIGCHQFLIHPVMIVVAWFKIYKKPPKFWQLVCIFLHDIGHIRKQYLTDYEQKKEHWKLGAQIAFKLYGEKGYLFIAGHTKQSGHPRSKMFLPDKYSWLIAPRWWLRLNDKIEGFGNDRKLDAWLAIMKENFKNNCPKGSHQIYLELKKEKQK